MTEPLSNVVYRPEREGEEASVRAVIADAFGERKIADLVDRLRVSPDWISGLSFVAEAEGELIAHILFTRALLDAPTRLVDVLVLSPVSVATRFHGRGVGSGLVRYGLARSAAAPSRSSSSKARPVTTRASRSSGQATWAFAGRPCASRKPPFRSSSSRRTSRG